MEIENKNSYSKYTYYMTEDEAILILKKGDVVAYEPGLGWYKYNKKKIIGG